jgi:formate dehydrogenase subunit gamma
VTTTAQPAAPAATWDASRGEAIIEEHATKPGALLPILHALQEEFGCVPEAAKPMIALRLNLSRAEVHGVVSFYHDFRSAPAGRHVLKLCRAEACQSMGCERVHKTALDRLGIGLGDTTADGQLTVEAIYCLGLCATAPSAMIDGRPVGRLTAERLDGLVREAMHS